MQRLGEEEPIVELTCLRCGHALAAHNADGCLAADRVPLTRAERRKLSLAEDQQAFAFRICTCEVPHGAR